jgi:hypothetical protein
MHAGESERGKQEKRKPESIWHALRLQHIPTQGAEPEYPVPASLTIPEGFVVSRTALRGFIAQFP